VKQAAIGKGYDKFHYEAIYQMSTAILPDQRVLFSVYSDRECHMVYELILWSLKFISINQEKKSVSTSQYAPCPYYKYETISAV
jgi:hypothetical protein